MSECPHEMYHLELINDEPHYTCADCGERGPRFSDDDDSDHVPPRPDAAPGTPLADMDEIERLFLSHATTIHGLSEFGVKCAIDALRRIRAAVANNARLRAAASCALHRIDTTIHPTDDTDEAARVLREALGPPDGVARCPRCGRGEPAR